MMIKYFKKYNSQMDRSKKVCRVENGMIEKDADSRKRVLDLIGNGCWHCIYAVEQEQHLLEQIYLQKC